MKSAADYFYPPAENPIMCSDGKERKLGDDQYLNRLEEFIATALPVGTSTDVVRAELSFLDTFARRLNEISSKGVPRGRYGHGSEAGAGRTLYVPLQRCFQVATTRALDMTRRT